MNGYLTVYIYWYRRVEKTRMTKSDKKVMNERISNNICTIILMKKGRRDKNERWCSDEWRDISKYL